MNTYYNVISMYAEAFGHVLPRETRVKFAIWIKVEKLDFSPILLQRTPTLYQTFSANESKNG